jgi:23S rRNA pseudouridine1911/1915/1917 synthase
LSEQTKTPLLADALYGRVPAAADLAKIATTLGRQALHAAVLGFTHPITQQALRFEVAPPADFAQALASLRALG